MQQTRFMVLTGHLNDYPLPDLVGILRHQRKTGRLLIEYPIGPSSFFFKDGELVDVQLGELSGIQAVCIAISQPNAAFNFNPLVQPSAQSIDNSLQKVVTQLLDCWEEETPAAKVKSVGGNQTRDAFLPAPSNDFVESDRALAAGDDILSLPPPSAAVNFSRPVVKRKKQALYASAVGLLLLSVPAVIALTNSLGKRETPAPSSAIEAKENSTDDAPNLPASPEGEGLPEASSSAAAAVINTEPRAEQRRLPREQPRVETNAAKRDESSPAPLPAPPAAPTTPVESDAASRRQNVAAPSAAPPPASAPAASSGDQTLTIVMRVDENGRVTQAHVANRRPGMEAFEASALRIARQRRFPPGTATTETMRIKVAQPK